MLKKRQIVLVPLLLASIVMLMSTVMPHHHHGNLICFTYSHCEKTPTEKDCQHEHDSNSSERPCEVEQLFQTDIVKQHHSENHCYPDIVPDQLFFPLLALIGIHQPFLTEEVEILPPIYRERLHPITWSLHPAGRAPPVVIA